MKKRFVVSLVGVMLAATLLVGCGSGTTPSAQTESAQDLQKNTENSENTADAGNKDENTDANAEDISNGKAESDSSNEASDAEQKEESADNVSLSEEGNEDIGLIDRSETFDLIGNMTVGWNLGNTMDAHGTGNTVASETYWGNPKTTQEMIDMIANQGFNTIRIPVTFAEHVGQAPDYKIDEAWLDRVQEIVDYAMNDEMYILLDTHHEPDYWLVTDPAKTEQIKAELCAIWKQVGERFKDYNEHLLFEGMNESRMKGSAQEWNGGTAEEQAMINELNHAFVDTVRATGGKNENRVLVICPYGNSANMKALKAVDVPADNHIAVAIHMYTPYVFTYVPESGSLETWDGSKKAEIVNTIKQIDSTFLKNDVPVIITEFGAQNKNNVEEIVKWLSDYQGYMNKYGIPCIWWDNGFYHGTGNERFGIFDRNNLSWYEPDIANALVENAALKEADVQNE